ncbi:MAG: hypothetical protein ABSF92_10630 [Candidatus Acidiferrales bacterium]
MIIPFPNVFNMFRPPALQGLALEKRIMVAEEEARRFLPRSEPISAASASFAAAVLEPLVAVVALGFAAAVQADGWPERVAAVRR